MTVHDGLFQFFSEKIKSSLYEDLGEYFYLMGISHSFPREGEFSFLVFLFTIQLLKAHGVKPETEFPDMIACEQEIKALLSAAEKLAEKMVQTGQLIKLSKHESHVA